MRRYPNPALCPNNPARILGRQIILSHMNTIPSSKCRKIRTIVQDQPALPSSHSVPNYRGSPQNLLWRPRFIAILQQSHTSRLHGRYKAMSLQAMEIQDAFVYDRI
jgi:hypothetical protein